MHPITQLTFILIQLGRLHCYPHFTYEKTEAEWPGNLLAEYTQKVTE